jgi:hypothetical protein
LADEADKDALINFFRKPGPEEQLQDEEDA